MDIATVLTLAQTLLQLLDSPISREVESLWGYKSQLQKLRNTISTIQDGLANIERRQSQQLPINIPPVTLERLQVAVYQADDLFDEVATVSHLKRLMPGNKLSKELRLFFSRFNQLHYAFTKSRKVTKVRKILDDIAQDHHDFGGLIQPPIIEVRSIINSSRETHSFLCKEDMIIGRVKDKEIVIDRLLHAAVEENVSVVSIVGFGGLGKTALAKLVYNDDSIQTEFSPKMWVCVSDDFDVKSLLGKILAAATNRTNNGGLSMDQLQIKLREQLHGKKYLLVLDDVWNEDDVMKWDELRNILIQGGTGSRIIVTTRSKRVANVAGSSLTHELQGLSDDDSWKLFQKVARMESHLDEIGKKIVRKCFNVPLAIRFVGSLLQGQSESVWQDLKNADLAHIKQDENVGIIPVLKISYNHLPRHLKSCFSYYAIYPKDYEIRKEDLIYQWMAQDFIKPSDKGLSLEDEAEDYFMKLLQRCFFQDIIQDVETGVILSCKMHDLVHDLAKEVAGIGIMLSGNDICSLGDDKTRHVFFDKTLLGSQDVECYATKMKNLRTFLAPRASSNYLQFSFKMRNLRVLDLSSEYGGGMKTLPGMMGELLHLRYLDLSRNEELIAFPDSITQLYNLQTLKLKECGSLKELPRDLRKLVNLRLLDIEECSGLRYMPRGMNRMTCLRKLTMFVASVVKNRTWCLEQDDIGRLDDLKDLNSLRDGIQIMMKDSWTCDGEEVKEGGYLINKPLLNEVCIRWKGYPVDDEGAKKLLQGLQPHPNIKKLTVDGYAGVGFPRWGHSSMMNLDMNTPLPNLVKLCISYCARLECLPLLSQLRHLKVLILRHLLKVEYMESRNFRRRDELVFFPSLEILELEGLPELKGSLIVPEEDINTSSSSSNHKSNMGGGRERKEEDNDAWSRLSSTFRGLVLSGLPKMVKLPKGMQHLTSLRSLYISDCVNLEEIPAWIGCLSSLQRLEIYRCKRVKSLPEEMRHLTCLTHLSLYYCSPELKERCKEPTGADWPNIKHIQSVRIR